MARRTRMGDYEPLKLYDEPTAMDAFGHVKTVEAGGSPVLVEDFRGALRPLSVSEVARGGLDAGREYEEMECRQRTSINVDRIVYRGHTAVYYRISLVRKPYRNRLMWAILERLALAPSATVPT